MMPNCGVCGEAYSECQEGHEYQTGPSLLDADGMLNLFYRVRNRSRNALAIVRKLADKPILAWDDDNDATCYFCGCYYHLIGDPANHKPDCLWRQAKEITGGQVG